MTKSHRMLRFAFIKEEGAGSAWQDWVIKKLVAQPNISLELELLHREVNLINHQDDSNRRSDKLPWFWNTYYNNWIKKKSKALKHITSFTTTKIPKYTIELTTEDGYYVNIDGRSIDYIAAIKFDFIINFSQYRIIGAALNISKYGIWEFSYSDPLKNPGKLKCLWEIYNNDPITKACIYRISGSDKHRTILKEGCFKTSNSVVKNIDNIHLEVSKWPLSICKAISEESSNLSFNKISSETAGSSIIPKNYQLPLLGLIQFKHFCKKALKSIFYTDYWNIGIALIPIHEFLNQELEPEIVWFPRLPFNRFMADPFALYFNNKLHIIYEDFKYNEGIGKIASLAFNADKFEDQHIVLDEKFHMSYPFLINHKGSIYCIPETYQKKQVRLYKAENFPAEWKLEKVLIDNYAGIDSTVLKYKNTWYLFSTDKDAGAHFNLNIHYSESLFGPWQVHPKNPVKTDIRSARPAGTFFTHEGEIFRPSMDYSEKVEGRITLNKILLLTTTEFKEEFYSHINPFKNTFYSDKVHTLSQVGQYTLIDGAKELFVFRNLEVLKYKVNRLVHKFIKMKK